MKEIADYKHFKEIDGMKMPEFLYINNFPKGNLEYKEILIQIIKNLKFLYIDHNIIYNRDQKTKIKNYQIPLKNPVTGLVMYYDLVKKFNSVENVYELRYPLGQSIHPRWIFVPFDQKLPTVIFSYFFEKVINDNSSDYTQVCIEETQRIFGEMLSSDSYNDYLEDNL